MPSAIVLDVNGRDGITVDRQPEQSWAIARAVSTSIHGSNGANATEAVRGEPAGTLFVELSPSPTRPEGFVVKTLGQVPANRIAAVTEILPHRDIVLQAIGGNGEGGRRGADGQSGRDGTPGTDATRVQDAMPGTNGGNGGAAGGGSNGANGGEGGKIRVYVDDENTHLLLAASWDVAGGRGGKPGEHGVPGMGGKGGKGGQSFTWQEQNGYQYRCTENCAGRTTVPAGNVRSLSRHDPRLALVSGIGGSVSAGSSLQTAIVRLAQYRANTVRDTTGLCECSGGNGHCTGCDAIPVFQKRERQPGADGVEGHRGDTPIAPLFPGANGRPGAAAIHVTSKTGPEQIYRSRYQLELVDFDVEDENEDGINEPGEHIFIRRIRVKNTGGMPSPMRQSILEVIPSDHLLPVPGNAGRALIPTVLAGQTVTLPGSIKVRIQEPDIPMVGGSAFKDTISVALKATMPGLNRRLDHFDIQKAIDIQYPLELECPDILRTVAQGSQNKISIKINNKGSKAFGIANASPRRAEIRLSIPAETGSLHVSSQTWAPQITAELREIDPMADIKITKTAKISHRAKDHAYSEIRVELYISNPNLISLVRQSSASTQRITQSFVLKIQVAASHIYDEDAGILVVTNEKTPADQFEAIGDFIRKDLGLKMDVWNVSLYGGLVQHDQSAAEVNNDPQSILNEYRGRTIIFLGNKFEHFGLKEQTILELCESQIIATECFSDSSCLLLGSTASTKRRDKWLKTSVFPVSHRISEVSEHVTESSTFNNKTQLVASICEQMTTAGTRPGAYQIECIPRWYYGGAKITVKRQAKEVRRYLKTKLPQERFLVCAVAPRVERTETLPGYVAVWHGLPPRGTMFATEPKPLQKERGQPPKLHPFDTFNIVCALPYLLRIRLLCTFDAGSSADAAEKDEGSNSALSGESNYADAILDTVQFSLEENVSMEIQNYLRQGSFMNDIALGAEHDPCGNIRIHLPCLDTVLQQFGASDGVSERALEVICTAITATNPQSIGQVARSLAVPFGQRRAQLKGYLTKRVDTLLQQKDYSNDALKAFHSSVRTRHSSFDGKKRNVARIVEERNRKFTKLSTHEYQKGRQTTQKLIPQTQLCTEADWDKQCQDVLRAHEKLEKNTKSAFERRAKMSTLRIGNAPDTRGLA